MKIYMVAHSPVWRSDGSCIRHACELEATCRSGLLRCVTAKQESDLARLEMKRHFASSFRTGSESLSISYKRRFL